jgi:hypothetical protein
MRRRALDGISGRSPSPEAAAANPPRNQSGDEHRARGSPSMVDRRHIALPTSRWKTSPVCPGMAVVLFRAGRRCSSPAHRGGRGGKAPSPGMAVVLFRAGRSTGRTCYHGVPEALLVSAEGFRGFSGAVPPRALHCLNRSREAPGWCVPTPLSQTDLAERSKHSRSSCSERTISARSRRRLAR